METRDIEMDDRFPGIHGLGSFINVVPVNDREHSQFRRALRQSKWKFVQVELNHKVGWIMGAGLWAGEYDPDAKPDVCLHQRLCRWWKPSELRDCRLLVHMDRTVEWLRENGYL